MFFKDNRELRYSFRLSPGRSKFANALFTLMVMLWSTNADKSDLFWMTSWSGAQSTELSSQSHWNESFQKHFMTCLPKKNSVQILPNISFYFWQVVIVFVLLCIEIDDAIVVIVVVVVVVIVGRFSAFSINVQSVVSQLGKKFHLDQTLVCRILCML